MGQEVRETMAEPDPSSRGRTGVEHARVVHRDGTVALDDVTLLAQPGEVLAVLGPSGSGKSTLLRAIAGLTKLNSGRVLIDGTPTTEEVQRRGVAMVFEDTALVPFMDVARNLSFGLELSKTPPEEVRDRVDRQARGLRLTRLLPRKPDTLSRGEQARVGIGRALVRAPRAFLLDEPLAHFDAGERVRMRQHVREVVKRAGVTTFYVSHDQTEALAIGDRIAVLNHGALVQVGTTAQLYDQPVDTFVAEFVGTLPMGLVPARLVVSGSMAGYRIGGRTLPTWAPPPPGMERETERPILLGLRAEDVHQEPDPAHGTVTGVVMAVEPIGRHATVTIAAGGERLHARFSGWTQVRPGDRITVGVDAARAHVFDPVTRRAIAHPSSGPGA
jgi:multiple sugar transport system ATP-binding protein